MRRYRVVVNEEGQYALWPLERQVPAGWADTGCHGERERCLAFVETVWTDLRPRGRRGGTATDAGSTGSAGGEATWPTLHDAFEEQAARTPRRIAVEYEGGTLSYGELEVRSNQVAHVLRQHGVGPEVLVGVCAERSPELVVGLLGVLKAQGAYVPLDPEYPTDRLSFMANDFVAHDAEVPLVLTQRHLADKVPGARVLLLDDASLWEAPTSAPPARRAGPADLAYAIYTSGSTGKPKAVLNGHRGVRNRIDWMQRTYGLTADDAVLQKTPTSFDVSVWEFFWPLMTGARLVLARPGGHRDPAYLRDLIVERSVTTAHFVPSMLGVFLQEPGIGSATSLRRVICSGEALPADTAREFTRRFPWSELHNLYGPTEAAIDVSAWHCHPAALEGRTSVPIGRAIQNMRLHVLDETGDAVAAGTRGELHIGGVGLARGYLGRPGLTAEKFVPDPLGLPGSRLYRTGDLASQDAEGVVEFHGRIDDQVKLRGLRVELGEIDAALRSLTWVRDAATVLREDVPGDQRLIAYVVLDGDMLDSALTRKELGAFLPDFMIPTSFVPLRAFPLTPNGKLDRKALPAPVSRGRPRPR
ncbi:amino acid adenylation domain-containing protein [Streptomyces sp. NPDC057307]|uniref:amino acid adenylation domain-containing protein n=1 Tax=Streptomyces sp. NPDC057307 TaxID=3346096 RepID=UPI003637967A